MINVIYEDNHIIVVEKPINVPVQKDSSNDEDLLSMIKNYLKLKYNKKGNVYLGLVHRLDRPASGVMVFAKTSKSASRLFKQMQNGQIKKTYLAVVCGSLKKCDILEDRLLKDEKTNIVRVDETGKFASLDYEVLRKKDNLNLVKIHLHTGRSHQIRVQFSSRGNALYGDQKYNKFAKKGQQLALFSASLEFIHPVKQEKMIFTLEMPKRKPFSFFE